VYSRNWVVSLMEAVSNNINNRINNKGLKINLNLLIHPIIFLTKPKTSSQVNNSNINSQMYNSNLYLKSQNLKLMHGTTFNTNNQKSNIKQRIYSQIMIVMMMDFRNKRQNNKLHKIHSIMHINHQIQITDLMDLTFLTIIIAILPHKHIHLNKSKLSEAIYLTWTLIKSQLKHKTMDITHQIWIHLRAKVVKYISHLKTKQVVLEWMMWNRYSISKLSSRKIGRKLIQGMMKESICGLVVHQWKTISEFSSVPYKMYYGKVTDGRE
jgi:hypothetical protein